MSVTVVIPWRDQGIRERQEALEKVKRWYRAFFGHFVQTITADSDGPWSLARARNIGVLMAKSDVVIISDADVVPEFGPLCEAIGACLSSGYVHLPYTTYRNGDFQWNGSVGGIYVTTPGTWNALGGQDDRFTGWGGEDHAFVYAHQTLLGAPMPRHEGVLTHFPHPSPPEKSVDHLNYQKMAALLERYANANGDIATMKNIIAERR